MEKRLWIPSSMMGKAMGYNCIKYELIDSLKNMRYTLVSGTKKLSLVIQGITKLCLVIFIWMRWGIAIYLNILFIQNIMNCECFNIFLLVCVYIYIYKHIYNLILDSLGIPWLTFEINALSENNIIYKLILIVLFTEIIISL